MMAMVMAGGMGMGVVVVVGKGGIREGGREGGTGWLGITRI